MHRASRRPCPLSNVESAKLLDADVISNLKSRFLRPKWLLNPPRALPWGGVRPSPSPAPTPYGSMTYACLVKQRRGVSIVIVLEIGGYFLAPTTPRGPCGTMMRCGFRCGTSGGGANWPKGSKRLVTRPVRRMGPLEPPSSSSPQDIRAVHGTVALEPLVRERR